MMSAPHCAFYAVARGRRPGVYNTWDECFAQVNGYSGARYKKMKCKAEARLFVESGGDDGGDARDADCRTDRTPPLVLPARRTLRCTPRSSRRPLLKRAADNLRRTQLLAQLTGSEWHAYPRVYSDGACVGNGTAHARAGCGVFFGDDDARNISVPLAGERQTNQRAEIAAALLAVREMKRTHRAFVVHTDSQYVCNAMNGWIEKWRASDFARVKNRDLFRELDAECRGCSAMFVHVPAHAGVRGNECADALAAAACVAQREGANED